MVKAMDRTGAEALQHGALCWREGAQGREVLLVTSRETGRWVIPKGWPIKGLSPSETAAREAWEEAGVKPAAPEEMWPLGDYGYDKVLDRGGAAERVQPCRVQVHALRVAVLTQDFPEREERDRRWCPASEAARLVEEPELRRLIEGFARAALPEA
ncbi:NUDIX hydrolase [Szabonella alba]|uniref:NUDIX hydrolase n=1 Tax=Szabonella alba TaxID=2804194 RepID=A0A8K0VBW7_9RHOB|nr:NUDIX hydrolase [Szabonella alba]MBL4916330.1 NUDIX hydrolase [Szabonella alba]